MTAPEFRVLEVLNDLEGHGWAPTAKDIAANCSRSPRTVGYTLRALDKRGHVGHEGRAHGGTWRWGLRLSGAQVLAA